MASKYIVLTLAVATLALLMHSSVMVTGQGTKNELFNETFNVTGNVTSDVISYVEFIEKLRNKTRLANGTIQVHVNNFTVPMLPPEQKCHNKYFRIVLRSDGSQITIQIQQVNLYFVAFQVANDTWYEFQHEGRKYINGSEMLNFTGSYSGRVEKSPVGPLSLKYAIYGLAKYNPKDKNQSNKSREYLERLMVMFPEAIRFRPVTELIGDQKSNNEQPINVTIHALFNNWGKISYAIWQYAQTGTFTQPVVKYWNITTVDQAVSIVCILLYQKTKKPPKQPKKEVAATAVAVVKMKKTSKLPKAMAAGAFDLQPQELQTESATVTVKKKTQLRAVGKKSEEYQRVPNTCPRGSHFKTPCSCHHLIQEDRTFDHCMVGDWWKYYKPANSTNTCSAAQD